MQPSPSHPLPRREITNPISYSLNDANAFMTESTAFVFRMDISSTQSAVCRSYQYVVCSKIFGGRPVHELLRLCVIADRLNLVGCHIWVSKSDHWLVVQLEVNTPVMLRTSTEHDMPATRPQPPMVTLIAKMLSSIEITPDGAATKPEETKLPLNR